jgi:hypothetical protein
MSQPRPKSAGAATGSSGKHKHHHSNSSNTVHKSVQTAGKQSSSAAALNPPPLVLPSASRPSSAAAGTRPTKPRDRGNLFKYLYSAEESKEEQKRERIIETPTGISTARSVGQMLTTRHKDIHEGFNYVGTNTSAEVKASLPAAVQNVHYKTAEFKPQPATKDFTSFFRGLDKEATLDNNKIRSGNINNKVIRTQCEQDFKSYWLSEKSLVKPSDRIKVVTYKPDKIFEEKADEQEEEEEDEPYVHTERPESRFERRLRMKEENIILIDPIAIQMKTEEIKLLTACKAQYRRSYNDVRRGIERGGTLEPVNVSDSSTLDAHMLIGNPAFVDSATPGDELILSAAASNVGPFFIMEFMKPLLNKGKGEDFKFEDILEIDLSGKMLGDEKCLCVARALRHTPNVRRLCIAGNALTDKSITPILRECLGFLGCTYIDISDNKIDSSSVELLKKTLMSKNCTLRELLLCSADIDDDECVDFISALHANKSLKYLDLSHNAIGKKEVSSVSVFVS